MSWNGEVDQQWLWWGWRNKTVWFEKQEWCTTKQSFVVSWWLSMDDEQLTRSTVAALHSYCQSPSVYTASLASSQPVLLSVTSVSNWQELSTMPSGAIFHASGCILHSCWSSAGNRFTFPHSRQVTIVCLRFLPIKQTKSYTLFREAVLIYRQISHQHSDNSLWAADNLAFSNHRHGLTVENTPILNRVLNRFRSEWIEFFSIH